LAATGDASYTSTDAITWTKQTNIPTATNDIIKSRGRMMKIFSLFYGFLACAFVLSGCLTGCTYSITMVHTQGEATDVVDETATNAPSTSVTPTVSIPAAAL
jgi:hypothetical protein